MNELETISATHGTKMRRALLRKLPALEHEARAILAELELDRDRDLRGAVELELDAFLAPLAASQHKDRR